MTYTTPIDPPSDGNAITRAFYITYVKDNIGHLRSITGGDPGSAGLVLVSNGASSAAWANTLSLAGLIVSGDEIVSGNMNVGGTGTINAISTNSIVIAGAGGITIGGTLTAGGAGAFGGAVSATAFSATSASGFIFSSAEGGGTDYFYESGSHTPAIAVSNVQIQRWLAGTTVITAATQITGQVTITGSGTYTGTWAAASDRRLKTSIQPLTGVLARIMAMKPITYRPSRLYRQLYGANELESGRYQGLIAQDVQQVFPEIVTLNKDDNNMLAVDYARLVVPLIAAVQELADQVDALKTQVWLNG